MKLTRCQAWRNQHTDNLVAVLNEVLLQYDFPVAAEAAATLLLATVRLVRADGGAAMSFFISCLC